MADRPPGEPDRTARLPESVDRFAPWLVPVLYLLSGLAFVSDLYRNDTLAFGIVYIPLVATALVHRNRSGLWILTALACILVIVGGFVPAVNSDLPDLIGNRLLSIFAILATAAFVHQARVTRDRLAAQTRRAEAAERIKSEVFTNLSHEMRTPLHALLGTLSLMIVQCRPDQREALERLRCGGKQLLDTIDNLIDLTRIDERALRREVVNVSTLLRDAADSARDAARERQIAIDLAAEACDSNAAMARGDHWATRRILDNLIANAVRFAPSGGTVSLATARSADTVTASIRDTGNGLPPGLIRPLGDGTAELEESEMPATGGTGLTLSLRLAREMNGRLTVISRSAGGATVSLSLPAA